MNLRTTKTQPNIVLILSDQRNPKLSGFAGSAVASTPHLDRVAARGTSFSNAYCTSPICVPARASIATGRYVHEIGAWEPTVDAPAKRDRARRVDEVGGVDAAADHTVAYTPVPSPA